MITAPAMEAEAILKDVFQRARTEGLSLGELVQVAEKLNGAGLRDQALQLYRIWIAFNQDNPLVHLAGFNYGVLLNNSGDHIAAVQAFQASLASNPTFAPSRINLGRTLEDEGLIKKAVSQWRELVSQTEDITPERLGFKVMALKHIGRVLETAGQLEEAEAALWQAIELDPSKTDAGQHWLALRQQQCKWPIVSPSNYVTSRQLIDSMSPMTIACYADDPLFQYAKAFRYNKTLVGRPDTKSFKRKPVRKKVGTNQRLRIGYVSSDLREHAVGFALCEVFELHDKQNVEVFAYYCGMPRTNDKTHERIRSAVHTWRNINPMTDAEAAAKIVEDEIDILIDVNGYTKEARAGIFAYRPAPVIVNFCGYPGTLASPFHQYLITDNYIVPPERELYYSEKIMRIACEQPVDRKREIAERPARDVYGLPEDAFVFVCFNGTQKVTEACFTRWMDILKATPGSILWLLGDKPAVQERLQDLAEKQGVARERIIFAPKVPNPHHLARIGLADLFLDTFPYGAHSTAADAITMGVPVLTVPGKSFASRFCASIVSAAGIPELICDSADDYVAAAIAVAQNPDALTALKMTLAEKCDTCALRDMPGLARRLEEIYWEMQQDAENGQLPVPKLHNLEAYYEIGAELIQRNIEFQSDEAYQKHYIAKLTELQTYQPLVPDGILIK